MNIRSALHEVTLTIPYFGKKIRQPDACGYAPGQYYSPIPDLSEIARHRSRIFIRNGKHIHGIDLRKDKQIELLNQLEKYYSNINRGPI